MNVSPGPVGSPLPTGTVTFLFSDIEGSTQRWDAHPEAMQDALRRHDALMRQGITQHQGHVFKTIGDAFCAAFDRPQQAVGAALAAQRAIAAGDFSSVDGVRVRMAVHTGTADERDGDYFGPAVNRVARLLAIGHGGQVLVSGVTGDLVQGALPPQASLRDLGEHRLRDLARPEYVYQLLAPDLAAEFPALRSLDVLPNNLPLQVTSFVSRETEVAEITALLEQHRLVTLVGSGGIGKTRTSLQVAANLLDGSGDGVWFIELAPLTTGDYIASTVAQAMGLTLSTEGDPVENLTRALKPKRALLAFDNCEHLVERAAHVISALLRGCPNVKMLASSRQGLGIAGEETYRLPSLEVPSEDTAPLLTARDAVASPAIALFAERARTVDKRFSLTDENAPIVAEICRRLDGIPLAIELAAARVTILSPRQLRERLDERFRVLTGGSRDVLPRQQTLRALIDWSHDLLDQRERTLFRRLGIFVNGFTLERASAVGSGDDLDEIEVFDVLASLVDKSLVLVEPAGEAVRYRLLESTRAYAREKLASASEREICAARHLRFLCNYFAECDDRYERTGRLTEPIEALTVELEDVRSALDYGIASGNAVVGGQLAASIGDRWQHVGLNGEGTTRSDAYIAALAPTEPRLLAQLSAVAAFLAGSAAHEVQNLEAATRAVAYARTCGDARVLAHALSRYAEALPNTGRFVEAEAALAEAQTIPDLSVVGVLRLLGTRATLSLGSGDLKTASRAYEQLRDKNRSLGNVSNDVISTVNLAEVEHARGQTLHAIAIVREILPALQDLRDRLLATCGLGNLAGYLAAVDDLSECCAIAREAIRELSRTELLSPNVAITAEHLALALALGGDLQRAAALAGYAETALQQIGFERQFTERTTHDRVMALLRESVPPDELELLIAKGQALAPEAAIALALEEP